MSKIKFNTEYRDTLTDQIQRATTKFVEHIKTCEIPSESQDTDDMDWRSGILALDLADTISASLDELSDPILKGMVLKEMMLTWIGEQFNAPGDGKTTLQLLVGTLSVPNG